MTDSNRPSASEAEIRTHRRSLLIRVICLLMLVLSVIFVLTDNNTLIFVGIIIIGAGVAFVSAFLLSK